jgi:uncharacterized protein YecE (DUF72 family)
VRGVSLGPTLVQLPPRWHRNVERLDEFLATATGDDRTDSALRWAVELRDPTWLHDDVFTVLERHGAALCVHDLLPRHPWVLTTNWTYVRFHGPHAVDRAYVGRYGGRRLARPAQRLRDWLHDGVDVFAYFNNDFHGDAVQDAQWLRARVAS